MGILVLSGVGGGGGAIRRREISRALEAERRFGRRDAEGGQHHEAVRGSCGAGKSVVRGWRWQAGTRKSVEVGR